MREHRVLIVAGDNQDERVFDFSMLSQTEPHIVYRYEDAGTLKKLRLEQLSAMLEEDIDLPFPREMIEEEMDEIRGETDDDFFDSFTYKYDHDEDGNAISYINEDGKFVAASRGGSFAQPFILKDGTTSYSAKKSDIDWSAIHRNPEMVNLYERTWEMCVEGLEPVSDVDRQVYENMKDKGDYFENFNGKDEYVSSCCSFWAFAFLNEADIWIDADDCPVSQFEWMSTFYDRFIKHLPDDTELTVFEYITE